MCTIEKYAIKNMTPVSAQETEGLNSAVPIKKETPFAALRPYNRARAENTIAVDIE